MTSDLNRDDSKAALARAFDAAWERFISREGTQAETDENRKRLAERIVWLAKAGQTNESLLGEAAYIYLCVAAETARLGMKRRGASNAEVKEPEHGGRAFAPETVAAMSTALDLCLDELPFRIPSDALQKLSSSILDDAASGERDPDRLHHHALEALKARE